MKLVLVGNTGVGKTWIARMGTMGAVTGAELATLVTSYMSKLVVVAGSEVLIQVWDTAGQEQFRATTPFYFHGAHVGVITYAINDLNSFEAVDSWVKSLHNEGGPEIILFLVGNKCDLEEERVIGMSLGKKKAEALSATFFEVSARTGNRIGELFEDAAKAYLDRITSTNAPTLETAPLDGKAERRKDCC
jgi:small GTP-binding protein